MNEFVLSGDLKILGSVSGIIVSRQDGPSLLEASQSTKSFVDRRQKIMESALTRLKKNAADIGADGVIGVEVLNEQLEKTVWKCSVTGTAVSGIVSEKKKQPIVCTLTAQEYWALQQNGYQPVGLAYGVSTYFQKSHERVERKIARNCNTERADFTRGFYAARKYALAALSKEAVKLNADGVIAIHTTAEQTLSREFGITHGMLIEFKALGTAIVAAGPDTLKVDCALSLSD